MAWQEGVDRNLERLYQLTHEQTKENSALKKCMEDLLTQVKSAFIGGMNGTPGIPGADVREPQILPVECIPAQRKEVPKEVIDLDMVEDGCHIVGGPPMSASEGTAARTGYNVEVVKEEEKSFNIGPVYFGVGHGSYTDNYDEVAPIESSGLPSDPIPGAMSPEDWVVGADIGPGVVGPLPGGSAETSHGKAADSDIQTVRKEETPSADVQSEGSDDFADDSVYPRPSVSGNPRKQPGGVRSTCATGEEFLFSDMAAMPS
jgi:hypothetical protein